jgi:signal transduction histidine kinase
MILAATGMLASIAILGWVSWTALRRVEAEAAARRLAVLSGVAAHLDDRLTGLFSQLQELATAVRPALAEPSEAFPLRTLQSAYLRAAYLDAVFVLDAQGRLLASEPGEWAGHTHPDLGELVARTVSGGVPVVSDLMSAGDARQPARAVALAVPVTDWGGKVVGVAGGTLDPTGRRFRQMANAIFEPRLGEIALVDGAGRVIAPSRGDRPEVGSPLPRFGQRASVRLGMAPWRVVIADPPGTAAPSFLPPLAWLTPLLVALALLFAWGAGRSVSRPLLVLTAAAERIAWGDLRVPVPPLGQDEVGRLGQAFERMRQALQRSLDKVAAANAALERRVEERTRELALVNAELQDRERIRLQLLRKVISAQEDERKRLARELHDETTQTLTALGVRLQLAASATPETRERELAEARALAARSLDELRRLMHDLRPSVLDDLGLVPALRWYADRHLAARDIAVRFEVGPLPDRLPYELETALFRAAQEALTNVWRHASAEMVLVEIAADGTQLALDIEDDGKGFDPTDVAPRPGDLRGLGLLGMRERVELFGGTVTIKSAPGRGTHVSIRVPLPEDMSHEQAAGVDR